MDSPSERSLRHMASQETMVSLLQLDPTPMDSPTPYTMYTDKDLPPLPDGEESLNDSFKGRSTGSLGLSGSSNGATGPGGIYYLTRIQKFSSYATGIFASLHVANVSIIPAITRSVPGSETYLLMSREIYQTSLTEAFLVALPVVAHVCSGIALRWLRRSQMMQRYGGSTPGMYALHRSRTDGSQGSARSSVSLWPPLTWISASGYLFTVFYSAHVYMNRILPLQVEGDSSNIGLAYVAHGFARHPLVAKVAYYGLIAIGCGHMIWGQARWLGVAPSTASWFQNTRIEKKVKRQRMRKWWAVQGLAMAATGLWAIGGIAVVANGGLMDGWIGKLYDDMFARVGL